MFGFHKKRTRNTVKISYFSSSFTYFSKCADKGRIAIRYTELCYALFSYNGCIRSILFN